MDMTRLRIGAGHDIHRLYPGSPLVLGGVEIPSGKGFRTHSDGDVLCHAVIDALAGAMADGDLGTHYPEDDPAAEDARSLDFVAEFAGYVRDHGYEIVNLDSFVVLGLVKLRPHLDAMRANLAIALELPFDRVSVKARSNDNLGGAGRGEATSARAHALLIAPQPTEPQPS
jgi:2-C-methyl-D-erythritol 2,4-cyclodiphosphate synthase